jgi:ketosteroid isomerase-like protein
MSTSPYALLAVLLATGCSYLGLSAPDDEELALRLLRDYEAAVAAYDSEAAMALLADDYRGRRNSGKEGVAQMVDRMEEQGSVLELDLREAVVTVDGDAARVSEVGNRMGQWEMKATYVLARSPAGWRIRGMETER